METNSYIKSFDDKEIFFNIYEKVENPKAVMLIIHGMVEHSKRYEDFAKFLNKNGIIVMTFDLRGHGQTVKNPNKVGTYENDIFKDSTKDAIFFSKFLKEKYKLPLIVLGHSFGSFLLQSYVENYSDYDVAIFSGSANMKGMLVKIALMISKLTRAFKGKDAKAKLIHKMSLGGYAKKFIDKNWLTRDRKIFEAYLKDPFCGTMCSANFYVAMFNGLKNIYKTKNLNNIPKSKPLLIISGDKDPVGGEGKLTTKLYELYKKINVEDVTLKLYDGARHEILNETNKQEVYDDVLAFCNKHLENTKQAVMRKRKEFYDKALER